MNRHQLADVIEQRVKIDSYDKDEKGVLIRMSEIPTIIAALRSGRRPKANGKIEFDSIKAAFVGITEEDELRWQDAYPAVPIPPSIAQAAAWLQANPANRKKNNERFLVNWFSRSQDKAARVRR